jgi:hypothetical protein
LCLDLGVGFYGDVLVGLQGANLVLGEFGTKRACQQLASKHGGCVMYVKPLMSVNSFVILPPWSWTFCFALSSSSWEAPDLRVTLPATRLDAGF